MARAPRPSQGGETHQQAMSPEDVLTTAQGAPVADDLTLVVAKR